MKYFFFAILIIEKGSLSDRETELYSTGFFEESFTK